ncbi:MAG: DnaJ domain-containing protein [Halobacteria archaeon]|nr:DnaJ domain-containing protein [Halobacteria archaeon]
MSIIAFALVSAVALALVAVPLVLLKSLSAYVGSGSSNHRNRRYGGTRSSEDYKQKTQDDLRDETAERVRNFLDRNDFDYETDRDFEAGNENVTVPFYVPEADLGIILDDWYDEYLLSKNTGMTTVIVELHVTEEYQRETLRHALGVEPEMEEDVEIDGDFSDVEVLGLESANGDLEYEEIRDAYRERIKETHPDQNDSDDAEEEFIRVKKAYENLKEEVEVE